MIRPAILDVIDCATLDARDPVRLRPRSLEAELAPVPAAAETHTSRTPDGGRARILEVLRRARGEVEIEELAVRLAGMARNTLANHLLELRRTGRVTRRTVDGTRAVYWQIATPTPPSWAARAVEVLRRRPGRTALEVGLALGFGRKEDAPARRAVRVWLTLECRAGRITSTKTTPARFSISEATR